MRASLWAITVATFGFVGVAQADIVVPEPKRDACAGKKDNDACELEGKAGTCKKQTCSRKVGGVLNPSVVDEDCILCDLAPDKTKAEAPTPTPTDTAKPDATKPDATKPDPTQPPATEPTKAAPPSANPAADNPAPTRSEPAKAPAPAPEADKNTICSISTDALSPTSALLGIVLLALARRSRRP